MILHLSTFLDSARRALVHALVMNHFLFLTILSFDVILQTGHTGMALYIHQSIKTFTKRRNDLILFIEDHNLFHPFQSGFRRHHSCHTALIRLCDTWLSAINKTQVAGAVFLDLKKAFDLVDHSILLKRFFVYLQNLSTVSFLTSCLQDRIQRVFLNGQYSTESIVECGIPQGFVLGPLLFCIFINDLPLNITNDKVVCDLFADDDSIHSCGSDLQSVQTSIQEGLNDISTWCDQNRVIIHPHNAKCMVLTTRQKHQRRPLTLNLTLGRNSVQQVGEHWVQGLIIDEQLRRQSHIDNICKHVSKNLFLPSQLRHYVDSDARKIFFQAHLLSHINYASTVWSGASEVHLKKLNSLHRRAAKLILPDQSLSTKKKLNKLNILPLDKQLKFNRCVTMFKIHTGKAPPYLSDFLHRPGMGQITMFYRALVLTSLLCFAFAGSWTCNTLPPTLKTFSSLCNFKINVRKFLHSALS